MNDQAAGLRELVATMDIAPPQSQARVVAVTSGKGGVGKTNISVNLAIYLSRMGRKVALLDADLALANADLIAGVKAHANLAHVIAGRKTLDQIMITGPGGFTLIPAASGLAQMADLDDEARTELLNVMHQVESDHDLILVDTGAGINPTVLSFLLSADEALVVTTAEPTAVTDAYALIKVLCRANPDASIALIQNMVSGAKEGRVVFEKINGVCSRFLRRDLVNAGYVPYDKELVAAVRDRTPLALRVDKSPAGRCIERLAMRLDVDTQETPGAGGFFKKVTRWLRN